MTQLVALVERCETLPDDTLLAALGVAVQGSGLDVSPVDLDRPRRFARQWLDLKAAALRERARQTDAFRAWAATSGPQQVMEPGPLACALAEDGIADAIAAPAAVALHRRELAESEDYDVAISCADPQSDLVSEIVSAARAEGLRVFYEREMTFQWWGKNFLSEGRRIYGRRCRFFVPILSTAYLADARPRDAFASAMSASIEREEGMILPVLVGDVEVPPEMLPPHVGYLRAEQHSPTEIAGALRRKVEESRDRAIERQDIGFIVRDAYGRKASPPVVS